MLLDPKYDLTGKVAIVTGAGRGMGEATSKLLAAHGAIVNVNDIDRKRAERVATEIIQQDGTAVAMPADVADYGQVFQMVETVLKTYGRTDILVNNAGILRRRASIEEISSDEWDLVFNVNAKGVFNCSKAVMRIMKQQQSGKIVNISSSAGRSTSELGGAHYTASKAAVLGLTRHFARELAPFNINVNAICPGLIATEMIQESTTPEELEAERKQIPMGRFGTPEEEADLVLYLVSEASSYINGAIIDLNGASLLI
ncbi:MAG: SDR family NAD(P)-dependent oxidoreductase [Candidatus Heimdallarchaeota archaeon]